MVTHLPVSHERERQALSVQPSILCETHSLTEVRGESTDPDDSVSTLMATQTLTKTNNESRDDDTARDALPSVELGSRMPLLFQAAVNARGEAPRLQYDEELLMCISEDGSPLINKALTLLETQTETAARAEETDSDLPR